MQTIICFGVLFFTGYGLRFHHEAAADRNVNYWDRTLNYVLDDDKVFVGMKSWHDNDREDRRFRMYWGQADSTSFKCSPLSWTDWQNVNDGELNFECPYNQALAGVYSVHNNHDEDRRWKFKCCDIRSDGKYYITSRQMSSYLNGYDEENDYQCNPNEVMTGVYSVHDDDAEDRRWKVQCGLIQERENALPFASDRQLKEYLNDWDQEFTYFYGSGRLINGLSSYHDNDREDRRFRVYTVAPPEGMTCNWLAWTDYQNDYDSRLDFTCPDDSVLIGIGSRHNNDKEDRQFKFKCCTIGNGYHITSYRHQGYNNEWDGDMDDHCAMNEAMVGLKAYHDDDKEDRRFSIQCGTIEKDFDDCSAVNVIAIEVDEENIEWGDEKIKSISEYSADFNACGNSNSADTTTIKIENSKSVEVTETISLAESLEETFSYSRTFETQFTIGSTVAAEVGRKVRTSAEFSREFSFRTSLTADHGFTMGSTETTESSQSSANLQVFSAETEYSLEPFQWRQVKATYMEREVTVPVRMHAQCVRHDGKMKTMWIDTVMAGSTQTHISTVFEDLTPTCPQSYYHNCECVDQLGSDFLPSNGCQLHPNFDGHTGCYVYKGADCGNGRGLQANTPPAGATICTDLEDCPGSQSYLDYPIDRYVFEWSYKPCGGEQYYPGDPGYTGPAFEDLVWKVENKHCGSNQHGTFGTTGYSSRNEAITECDKANAANPNSCLGVYDGQCDNKNEFYLCATPKEDLKDSDSSCVYEMQDKAPTYPVGQRRLGDEDQVYADEMIPAPSNAAEPEDTRTCAELWNVFGNDLDLASCVDL